MRMGKNDVKPAVFLLTGVGFIAPVVVSRPDLDQKMANAEKIILKIKFLNSKNYLNLTLRKFLNYKVIQTKYSLKKNAYLFCCQKVL